MTNTTGYVVMVTGGCGFLGQHIVKLLCEKGRDLREVRIFDVKDYEARLDFRSNVPIVSVRGDITRLPEVDGAMLGVDAVIHTAGKVSSSSDPDLQALYTINVQGTKNVLEACIRHGVRRLVCTSTVDVVVGWEEIVDGDETLPYPRIHLIPGYASTKQQAEWLILQSNGHRSKGGSRLRTFVIRPPVMYGEGDPHYVSSGLLSARRNDGILKRVGDGHAIWQIAYVGNVAWAHVIAMEMLEIDNAISGHVVNVTDDTPRMNTFDFMNYFLADHGFALSTSSIPYNVAYFLTRIAEGVQWALKPFTKLDLPTSSAGLHYICNTFTFSGKKAKEILQYQPLFTFENSVQRSLSFYNSL